MKIIIAENHGNYKIIIEEAYNYLQPYNNKNELQQILKNTLKIVGFYDWERKIVFLPFFIIA